MKLLVTCPPMLGLIDQFSATCRAKGIDFVCPNVTQTLAEEELLQLVPAVDAWIIGDDPATARVFEAGSKGRLRAAVKWGIGIDNVDVDAARRLGIPFANTPGMFGREVADVAMGYVIALARETFVVDRGVRAGGWPKPRGISLAGKQLAVLGLGDIGTNVARRALASEMEVIGFDPAIRDRHLPAGVRVFAWPEGLEHCDFLVVACALTAGNRRMVNAATFARVKPGLRLVNVSRGALVDEAALVTALESGQVHSAALDVFEREPLPLDSSLRRHDRCVFGSHNSSNTTDAVVRASNQALSEIFSMLRVS